jgi:hypothetical protein
MNDQPATQEAKNRAEAKYGFYIHLAVYILVNALLVTINLSTSPETKWFIWPLGGWGIGILFHALGVFVLSGKTSLKDKLLEREMRKQK